MAGLSATPFDAEPAPTRAQAEAITHDGHVLLAAGAGSGKTTTVVDKIIFALGAERLPGTRTARPCELHEIAAITFTNAAAADLKQKLRARLRLVANWHRARGDAAEDRRWRARIYEVERARIGTIHSFCAHLLRGVALRVGLDPAFRVLDEGEASLLRADCVQEVIRRAAETDETFLELAGELGIHQLEKLLDRTVARGLAVPATHDMSAPGKPDDRSVSLAAVALRLAGDVRAAVDARLATEHALDFDGVIARTRQALETNAEVLALVRRGLRWLFVDEFQDTDGAQVEIAYRITGFGETALAQAPRESAPSLCVVGDPKQSIYRFRRADVSLWTKVERAFANQGIAPIHLDTNFRSREPIVAYVNATFGGLIGDGPAVVKDAGHEVAYHPLTPHRRAPEDDGLVELLVAEDGDTADERRVAEAMAVAARLTELVNSAAAVIWDDTRETFRAAQWGDAAVLVRSRTPVAALEAVFRRYEIPYHVAGGSGFFGRREVRDIRLLLSALVDRHDDVAWLGVLRSPFVGLRDDTVLRWRTGNMRRPISDVISDLAFDGEAVVRARAGGWLAELRALRDRVPVGELIDRAIERSAYAAQLLTQEDGRNALMNVRKLIQIADGRPGDSVADFLAFLAEREGSAREGDAALFTAGENVVTIATVHSAKGLEWPIVFLLDLDRKVGATVRETLLADPVAGMALKLRGSADGDARRGDDDDGDGGEEQANGAFEMLKAREMALARAEEKRLWYVAATRARDRLVLCMNADSVGVDGLADVGQRREGGEKAPSVVKHWLLRALRPVDGAGGMGGADARLAYGEGGLAHRVVVHVPAPLPPVDTLPPVLPSDDGVRAACEGTNAMMLARVGRIAPAPSLVWHSASALHLLATDRAAYRERYVLGLPERRAHPRGDGSDGGGQRRSRRNAARHAVDTGEPGDSAPVPTNVLGSVLHGALERARDEDDLIDYLEQTLAACIGDEPGSARVGRAAEELRRVIEECRANPVVARLYDAAGAAHELPYTWFVRGARGAAGMRGAMDLVAAPDAGRAMQRDARRETASDASPASMAASMPNMRLEILDFKSHRIAAGAEQVTAAAYQAQADVYVAALAAITGTVPAAFTFYFSETAGEVREALDAERVEGARGRIAQLLDTAGRLTDSRLERLDPARVSS